MKKTFIFLSLLIPSVSMANLQGEMDSMFGSLSNITPTGVYRDAGRGVITGGRISIRNKVIARPKLLTFDPPKFSAGCGGIDLYGGSFSFISANDLQNYLRSIASNAQSYAFGLALEAMCPTCNNMMKGLQKLTNDINRSMKSSCNVAEAIVDSTQLDEVAAEAKRTQISALVSLGITDQNDAESNAAGQSPARQLQDNNPAQYSQIRKNIIWRVLKDSNLSTWFTNGDDDFLMLVMSMTGTIIVGDIPAGSDSPTINILPSKKIKLANIIDGGTVEIYKCADVTDCLAPTQNTTITIVGIKQKIDELINGNASSVGILQKYRTSTTVPFTDAEKSFIENAPGSIGTMIRNLAHNKGLVKALTKDYNETISRMMASKLIDDILDSVISIANTSSKNYITEATITGLRGIKFYYQDESDNFKEENTAISDFLLMYQKIRSLAKKEKLDKLLSSQSQNILE